MRRNLRFAELGLLAVASALSAVAACSGDEEGTPTTEEDAGRDGGSPDVQSPDATVEDRTSPPIDGDVDAGPKCKTAGCALSIAAGPFHTCAVLGDHTVKCWGENRFAELGTGTVAGANVTPKQSTPLVAVDGLTDAVAIAAGGEPNSSAFTCAILTSGAVRCWGSNNFSQLGTGLDASISPTGNVVPADASATAIDLGYRHACMIDTAGAVRCWGANTYGERGTTAILGAVPLEAGASALATGFYSTCAIVNREVVCFGNNSSGQVNPSSALGTSPATVVDGAAPAVQVAASTAFSCATLDDAGAVCWGINSGSQLGRVATLPRNPPASPAFTPGIVPTSVTAGTSHVCAIMSDRGVNCWGGNARGQSGDFSGKNPVTAPYGVGGIGNVVQLALGHEHSCALTEGGDVYCWGANAKGQLGPNTIPVFDGGADDGGEGGVDAASFDAGNGTDNLSHPDPIKVPL